MIDRSFIGKEYPEFSVTIEHDLVARFNSLLENACGAHGDRSQWNDHDGLGTTIPLAWPSILTFHGTACLISVWEDLGIDPVRTRIVEESFNFLKFPEPGEELKGSLCVEEIEEKISPDGGIEEQLDLSVEFSSLEGELLATYTCSYRIPLVKGATADLLD